MSTNSTSAPARSGVAGMTSAYFLAAAGHEVTVVERNAGVGLETSYANGGQLSYSYVAPLANRKASASTSRRLSRIRPINGSSRALG